MEPMQFMQMAPMKRNTDMQDFGAKMLQAALNQKGQNAATLAAQPQPGQTMPGGAMNITPATLPGGGAGLLGRLFQPGGMFGRAVQPSGAVPMDSTNALY